MRVSQVVVLVRRHGRALASRRRDAVVPSTNGTFLTPQKDALIFCAVAEVSFGARDDAGTSPLSAARANIAPAQSITSFR